MKKFIAIIIGVVFMAIGGVLYFMNNSKIQNCTVEVEATVVDHKIEVEVDGDNSRTLYYPIMEYEADGKTMKVTMDKGSEEMEEYMTGEKVVVLYNPNNVAEFIVKGDYSSIIISIVFAALGAVVTIAGIIYAIVGDKKQV